MGAKMNSATGSVKCEYANGSCAQKSLRADDFPVRAGKFPFRGLKIHSVRPFFHSMRRKFNLCGTYAVSCEPTFQPCGQNSICAAIFQSGRAVLILCGENL